jgi:hypothetical protein
MAAPPREPAEAAIRVATPCISCASPCGSGPLGDRVIDACRERCAICRLRISNFWRPRASSRTPTPSQPHVSNGPVLCALRHAAFDADIIGVPPDYDVEVRFDVLEEQDGPMLEHGLKGFHDTGTKGETPDSAKGEPTDCRASSRPAAGTPPFSGNQTRCTSARGHRSSSSTGPGTPLGSRPSPDRRRSGPIWWTRPAAVGTRRAADAAMGGHDIGRWLASVLSAWIVA